MLGPKCPPVESNVHTHNQVLDLGKNQQHFCNFAGFPQEEESDQSASLLYLPLGYFRGRGQIFFSVMVVGGTKNVRNLSNALHF